jgi:hypothetical protein
MSERIITDSKERARIIRVANQHRHASRGLLTESNFDTVLDRAQAISKQKLGQDLGPFFMISADPDLPYDTPYSGWASVRAALLEGAR